VTQGHGVGFSLFAGQITMLARAVKSVLLSFDLARRIG
jgi:hypothetical protein